jgi:hypothetical protein
MIVLHEHWWRWLNGLVELRDTEFFYPFDKSLGFSDVFLVQGILYSIFRLIGQDLAESWTYTTILLVILGNIGWIQLANKFLKSYFVKILFLISMISSLSFVNYFTLNPNIVGYAFLSWLSLFYLNIKSEEVNKEKQKKVSILIILLLVYALSCWYGAFFFGLIIIVKEILDFIAMKKFRNISKFTFDLRIFIYFLPIQSFFIWLFLFIYLPVQNDPIRPVEEMLKYSPRINYLANGGNVRGASLDGSVFRSLYIFLNLDNESELAFGVGIFVTIIAIFAGFKYIKDNVTNFKALNLVLSIATVYIYFLAINDNFSMHRIFFELVPGFNSIRYPARYVIVIGYFAIFGIHFVLDKLLIKTKSQSSKIFVFTLLFIVLLDQQRNSFIGWEKKQFLNTVILSNKEEIKKNCDYFYADFPGGWWYDQITSMTLAMYSGIPTINGYSGGFPSSYPIEAFASEVPPIEIFRWINKIENNKIGCILTEGNGVRQVSNNLKMVELYGFTPNETNGKANWQWAVNSQTYLMSINYTDKISKLSFQMNLNDCQTVQNFEITEFPNRNLFRGNIGEKGRVFDFTLYNQENNVSRIEIKTDSPPCKLEGDPRNLYFEIKNLRVD